MPKNTFNNKILLGVLVALVLIFFATDYIRKQKRSSSKSMPTLAVFEREMVDKIRVTPPNFEEPIEVNRINADSWEVTQAGKSYTADVQTVERFFKDLEALKTNRLVSRKPDRKADYSVNDSLGTRVQVFEGDETATDFYLGRFKYAPSPSGFGGITYIREADSDEIYGVDGFQNPNFNKQLAEWRIQTVLKFKRDEVEDLIWTYPADSGFVLNQTTSGWKVDASSADSTKATNYIVRLAGLKDRNFYEGEKPSGEPEFSLQLNLREAGKQEVKAWKSETEEDTYLIHSTMNEEAWFKSNNKGLFEKLFPAKKRFIE